MLFKKKQAADKAVVQNAATTLFANIKFADVDNPIRSMVVTSSIPNEGKTTVTVNLARAIAASGARVLLVECDMRRRSLANELGVHGRSGLYSVLADQVALQHAVVPTAVQNMYFLDAEPGIPNPADILSSKRFKRFAHDLKSVYDYVIFDTPPVGTFVDAAVASVAVDGVVLVVRDDFTKRSEVAAAYEQLGKAGGRIIGVVLNGCEVETGEYYYAYYSKDGKRVKKNNKASASSASAVSVPQSPRGQGAPVRSVAAHQGCDRPAMPAARGQVAAGKTRQR